MLSILSSVISFLGVYFGFWVAEKQSKHHINRIEALMLLVIFGVGGLSFLLLFK
ncbi:Uncharacterised protein [Avibacterium paragallinarum]|uniref:Uncharacterized protein n=1 Tax=Avibacterium paragallinarum TaxID=728 RepID=A0A380X339_AVIPA|nr:Uncharacterised protein [Avibacterium paragallinarum]